MLNTGNNEGKTPLYMAMELGMYSRVHILLMDEYKRAGMREGGG
jgi:hypothetical protein